MRIYKVLSVCGSGVATSTLAATKLQEGCKELGLTLEVMECKMTEVKAKVDAYDPDVIINTTAVNENDCKGIKVFSSVPFLTGIGTDTLISNICEYLKSK